MMNIVWLLNPSNQEQYAIASFETSEEAMNYKDLLKVENPNNLFFTTINNIQPEVIMPLTEALVRLNEQR